MRVREADLELAEKVTNSYLKSVQLKVGYRYGYTAIDIVRDGQVIDTLVAGLTKGQAFDLLTTVQKLLILEARDSQK
jgi:hypothetical protein